MTENSTIATEVPSLVPNKVKSCGGNACPTCNKCCDWYRSGSRWQKRADATCSSTTRTDTDGHPDGGGSTRTYVDNHGYATDWVTIGTTSTRDDHGGRYGHGVYTVTRGTADISRGQSGLCACKSE